MLSHREKPLSATFKTFSLWELFKTKKKRFLTVKKFKIAFFNNSHGEKSSPAAFQAFSQWDALKVGKKWKKTTFPGGNLRFRSFFFIVYNGNTKTQRDSQPPSVNFSLRDILLIKNVLFLRTSRYKVCLQKNVLIFAGY